MIRPVHDAFRGLFFRLLAVLAATVFIWSSCLRDRSTQFATFNIENFPKSDRQIDGAFEAIEDSGAAVVGVQEITEPTTFRREAKARLGDHWRFRAPSDPPKHAPGLLWDARRLELVDWEVHPDTVVYDGGRPVVEGMFETSTGGRAEVFTLHFKASPDGLPLRERQYAALRRVLDEHADDADATLVAGDFNSTEPRDRELLAGLRRATGLRWLSKSIDCTGYWKPADECRSFVLDHVFAGGLSARALGRGPCEQMGCEPGESCPTFWSRVSDHCPVTVEFLPD